MRRVRFARESGISIRNFFAVCASRDFENDGGNQRGPVQSACEADYRLDQRWRSAALRSRKARTRRIYSRRTSGIACAFRVEPIECVAARSSGPFVEKK